MAGMWIGLAHVVPRLGDEATLEGARGAFVNAVGLAQSAQSFERQVAELVSTLGLELIEIDEVELVSDRESRQELLDEMREAIDASKADNEIHLGSFHTYDDADDLM